MTSWWLPCTVARCSRYHSFLRGAAGGGSRLHNLPQAGVSVAQGSGQDVGKCGQAADLRPREGAPLQLQLAGGMGQRHPPVGPTCRASA